MLQTIFCEFSMKIENISEKEKHFKASPAKLFKPQCFETSPHVIDNFSCNMEFVGKVRQQKDGHYDGLSYHFVVMRSQHHFISVH